MTNQATQTLRALRKALPRKLSHLAIDDNGWTDLHYAATLNLSGLAQALLVRGARVDARLKDDGEQILSPLPDTLRRLGLSFISWEREGDTPLHLTAWADAAATAEVLIDHGADLHARLSTGGTTLNAAARFNSVEIANMLLARGALVDSRDREQFTPLHTAACRGKLETVELLLAHGADFDARADDNWTPLHLALLLTAPTADIQGDPLPIMRLLLDRGAEVNPMLKPIKATPLDLAEVLHAHAAARLLRQYGGDVTLEEKTQLVGLIDTGLGNGWRVAMPVYRRTRRWRPPRNRRRRKK